MGIKGADNISRMWGGGEFRHIFPLRFLIPSRTPRVVLVRRRALGPELESAIASAEKEQADGGDYDGANDLDEPVWPRPFGNRGRTVGQV